MRHQFLRGGLLILLLTVVSILLAEILLTPTASDLLLLALFLPLSGVVSVALALGFLSLYRGNVLRGMRGKLLVAVVLSAAVVMLNVGFTAYLMFLSSHDLKLLAILIVFSLGMAAFFALVIADQFHATLTGLLDGVRLIGAGDLTTRVSVSTGDEVEDIATEVNRMAEQLQASTEAQRDMEEARRHLISAVSHDLRTPLATMRAMIESINDGIVSEPKTITRYHRSMQGEIAYLSRLIDDLFELSQLDSGLLELRPEKGSVGDLVSDALEALRLQAQQRRLKLMGEISPTLPTVVMDVPRMQRVLYNLVQNAIRHTPVDGTVVIRAVAADEEVLVSVSDTGEGLDSAELPRIFERFYRGSRARSRQEAGSGLGLTIAKGIVELHGGRIWAESKPDQGAIFTFTLPADTSTRRAATSSLIET